MMNIVDTDNIIRKIMVVVVIFGNDSLCVEMISVYLYAHVLDVIVMNVVLSHDLLACVEVLTHCLVHYLRIVFAVLGLAWWSRWLVIAVHVWWWQLQAQDVNLWLLVSRVVTKLAQIGLIASI